MPWCPKCRRYQEEDDLCTNCWVEVVDELEPEFNLELSSEPEELVLIITAPNENEASLIESLLKSYNISSICKHRGIGGYMQIHMGISNQGIDIFVRKSQSEEAKAILSSQMPNEINNISGKENEDEAQYQPEREQVAKGLLWVYLIPILLGLVIMIFSFIKFFDIGWYQRII